jgi:DNA-binding response OmpR family regulator
MDLSVDDPYVSRQHCTLELEDGGVRVDASRSMKTIVVDGRELKCVVFRQAGSFSIGRTILQLRPSSWTEDTTLSMSRAIPLLTFRRSTRELLVADGTVVTQLSALEAAALEAIVARYPDCADHATMARAIWGEADYPRYLIHRLVQRLRDRLGDFGEMIENVRGAGYRLRGPVDIC